MNQGQNLLEFSTEAILQPFDAVDRSFIPIHAPTNCKFTKRSFSSGYRKTNIGVYVPEDDLLDIDDQATIIKSCKLSVLGKLT